MRYSDDASGFVSLSEAVPDVILEIRYYSTFNFVGERISGYEEPVALVTRETADALREVAEWLLPMEYRLKIFDAYRPQPAVSHFVRWAQDPSDTRMKPYFYPDLEKNQLFPLGFIAEHSGHSRGSSVDLTLFDMTLGHDADLGGAFDFFGDRSRADFTGLTLSQARRRLILRDAMQKHGFKPYAGEWWHYTLAEEPYPDTYFTFPVSMDSLRKGQG